MIELKNILLSYADGGAENVIFKNYSLKINDGEFVCLTGPSGSGKSSLMYIMSTLRKADAGQILIDGCDVSNIKDTTEIRLDKFGFIFQHHYLIPYLTVLENVCIAKDIELKENAIKILEDLGLGDKIDKKIYRLSGGEKQRVAIARALVKKPKYIFADEPTASLDHKNAEKIMKILKDLQGETTIICTTHDLSVLPKDCRIVNLGQK